MHPYGSSVDYLASSVLTDGDGYHGDIFRHSSIKIIFHDLGLFWNMGRIMHEESAALFLTIMHGLR
jgi:hypothetical protein